jgi:hypothetical protein
VLKGVMFSALIMSSLGGIKIIIIYFIIFCTKQFTNVLINIGFVGLVFFDTNCIKNID